MKYYNSRGTTVNLDGIRAMHQAGNKLILTYEKGVAISVVYQSEEERAEEYTAILDRLVKNEQIDFSI